MDLKIGEHYIRNLFGFDVHMDTLITLWIAMGFILLLSMLAVSKISIVPNKLQSVFEKIITIFVGMTKDLGKNQGSTALVLMCIFLLIIVSNLMGQLPWKLIHLTKGEFASPTNDINMTAALAVFVLIYYFYKGIKAKGLGYFKHYVQPIAFMMPFNILEDFTRPLTLALRLFANIFAGEVLVMLFAGLVTVFINPDTIVQTLTGFGVFACDVGLFLGSLLALPVMFFELFVAFIQALVFTLLANAYISNAVSDNH